MTHGRPRLTELPEKAPNDDFVQPAFFRMRVHDALGVELCRASRFW